MISITIIGGPTASGKSAYALDLAQQKNGVILCGDSLQLYDALPILTAQPSKEDKTLIEHRLYACMPPTQPVHLGWWLEKISAEIQDVHAQGKHPIIVGGTGLYLNALEHGLADIPTIPASHKQYVREAFSAENAQNLHQELERLDPLMAQRLHPNDHQRLLRAYEVITHTGHSLQYWQTQNDRSLVSDFETSWHLILPAKFMLQDRVIHRLKDMIKRGVLDEVKQLNQFKDQLSPTLGKAIGYIALKKHLEGTLTLEEALEKTIQQTMAYIKRQLTWFHHQVPQKAQILSKPF